MVFFDAVDFVDFADFDDADADLDLVLTRVVPPVRALCAGDRVVDRDVDRVVDRFADDVPLFLLSGFRVTWVFEVLVARELDLVRDAGLRDFEATFVPRAVPRADVLGFRALGFARPLELFDFEGDAERFAVDLVRDVADFFAMTCGGLAARWGHSAPENRGSIRAGF